MNNYTQAGVNREHYEACKQIQQNNQAEFAEQIFGSRRSLYLAGKMIATTAVEQNLDLGKLSNSQFISFLGRFNRQLYKQFETYPDLFAQKIIHKGVSRDKNLDLWDQLPIGSYFYNIDLSSAYWQVAFRLGYIKPEMFIRYLNDDNYKQAKRYCISFLARQNKMVYADKREIKCDTGFLVRVYDNIRQELYKIIETASNRAKTYLEFNIDGISVTADQVKIIKDYFKSEDLLFKTTQCRVMPGDQYLYGSRVRKFRNFKMNKYEQS